MSYLQKASILRDSVILGRIINALRLASSAVSASASFLRTVPYVDLAISAAINIASLAEHIQSLNGSYSRASRIAITMRTVIIAAAGVAIGVFAATGPGIPFAVAFTVFAATQAATKLSFFIYKAYLHSKGRIKDTKLLAQGGVDAFLLTACSGLIAASLFVTPVVGQICLMATLPLLAAKVLNASLIKDPKQRGSRPINPLANAEGTDELEDYPLALDLHRPLSPAAPGGYTVIDQAPWGFPSLNAYDAMLSQIQSAQSCHAAGPANTAVDRRAPMPHR